MRRRKRLQPPGRRLTVNTVLSPRRTSMRLTRRGKGRPVNARAEEPGRSMSSTVERTIPPLQAIGSGGEWGRGAWAPANQGGSQPIDLSVTGNIDASGTAHVRQLGYQCSYDF